MSRFTYIFLLIFAVSLTNYTLATNHTSEMMARNKNRVDNIIGNVRMFYIRIRDWFNLDQILNPNTHQNRTFGMISRRIQMTFIPLFYKVGVIGTMVAFLILITLKGLTIGVMLLILGVSNFLSKMQSFGPMAYPYPAPAYQSPTYEAPWKNIHVHIHPTITAASQPVKVVQVPAPAYAPQAYERSPYEVSAPVQRRESHVFDPNTNMVYTYSIPVGVESRNFGHARERFVPLSS